MEFSCIKYGDDISTDLIIAGKYTKTLNLADLALHCMEDLDEAFHTKVDVDNRKIVVAGSFFGCGSSREQAPVAMQESGIQLIVAKSFSRIFYRNAVNIGLPIVACNTDLIDDGDVIQYRLGDNVLKNVTKNITLDTSPLPPIMVEIMNCKGIIGYFEKHRKFELEGSQHQA